MTIANSRSARNVPNICEEISRAPILGGAISRKANAIGVISKGPLALLALYLMGSTAPLHALHIEKPVGQTVEQPVGGAVGRAVGWAAESLQGAALQSDPGLVSADKAGAEVKSEAEAGITANVRLASVADSDAVSGVNSGVNSGTGPGTGADSVSDGDAGGDEESLSGLGGLKDVVYAPVPDWVVGAEVDWAAAQEGPSQILSDYQHRLETGLVHSYTETAVRIDNPQALMRNGTLKYSWSPDKGDLMIHRVEILRDGEVIDLIDSGAKFVVLRRERGLEARLLDGRLTATLAVPGLEVGDVLRVAQSTTISDQALGDEVQLGQYLRPDPWRVGNARAIVSWPDGVDIHWQAGPDVAIDPPQKRGAYQFIEVDLPIAKREDMPGDAPSRFNRPTLLMAGSFENWQELSRVMAPHYITAATLTQEGAVAKQAAEIMRKSDDPLERTALAVQLVQDEVSYLLNGLNGGNYLPQSAEETWEKRYGDCKAKSVLLLSLLRAMEIESDVVLVKSRGGDAVIESLPIPGAFDHMIVRAELDGVTYWLDGTSSSSRLANLSYVPPFFYALPLRKEGADLVPLSDREQSFFDRENHVSIDHSAGVDLPVLFTVNMEVHGRSAGRLRQIIDENDPEMIKRMRRSLGRAGSLSSAQVTEIKLHYDDETATATVEGKGVARPVFRYSKGEVNYKVASIGALSRIRSNRARSAWRDIPVRTAGPSRNSDMLDITLPEGGENFTLEGTPQIEMAYGNGRYSQNIQLSEGVLRSNSESVRRLGEISSADLPEHRRAAMRASSQSAKLIAPADARRRWEYETAQLRRMTADARAAYDTAVDLADEDDMRALTERQRYFSRIFDYRGALADINAILDEEPSASLYLRRSWYHTALGDMDAAIADTQTAYDLDPINSTAYRLANLMARTGMHDEALTLLGDLPVAEDELDDLASARSLVLAMTGDVEGGLLELSEALVEDEDNAGLLNADCWYRGLTKAALDDAIAVCDRAVELTRSPANVLDSRAMVYYRRGEYQLALNDLDAALRINPGLGPSHYLRGILLSAMGDDQADKHVAIGLRISPYLKDYYGLFGIAP